MTKMFWIQSDGYAFGVEVSKARLHGDFAWTFTFTEKLQGTQWDTLVHAAKAILAQDARELKAEQEIER